MSKWKTPTDYWNDDAIYYCDYEERQKIGCTEKFHKLGFYTPEKGWDLYAEYKTLCKACPHYIKNVGIYFGNGKYTDDIEQNDIVWCRARISSRDELVAFLSIISKEVKAICFNDIRTETLFDLEAFSLLECVLINYCPKLISFWDFSKTPCLKVLEYVANAHLTDLTEIGKAKSLEYFGIGTLVSRENLNMVDSFYPLTLLENLKEVSLNATMCSDNNIDHLINIPNLKKLWISPHTFSTEDFAKFEARKFKIYEEYGIYQNGEDYVRPLGKGGRCFRSEKSREKFKSEYFELMSKY